MEIQKGFKRTDIGLIPNDWDTFYITQVIETTNGIKIGPFGSQLKKELLTSSGYKVYGQENVYEKDMELGNRYISKEHFKKLSSCELKEGDFIISMMGTIGKCMMVPCKYEAGIMDSHLIRIRLNKSKIDSELLLHYFSSSILTNQVNKLSVGGIMDGLSSKIVKNISVPLPPTKAEQTAIAEALNDADALITELEKLIVKKKAIKQGAMQELLKPKEGWEVKTIGEIAIVGRGRVISHKEISKSIEGKYPVYSSQTFNNGVMGYLDSYDFDGEYLTWTTDGVYAGKVYHRNGQFNCTNVCGTIKLKKDYAPFVAYLLDTITPDHVSRNLANPKLMNDPMKRIEIPLPNHEEQIHIAQILSDMDNEIEALEKKLDKYKMLKQGMMQNLLTGKIRLI